MGKLRQKLKQAQLNRYGWCWSWNKQYTSDAFPAFDSLIAATEFAIDLRQWHLLGFNFYLELLEKPSIKMWNIFFLCFRYGKWKTIPE